MTKTGFYSLPGFLSTPFAGLIGVESLEFPFVSLRLFDGVLGVDWVLGEFAAFEVFGLLDLFIPGDLVKYLNKVLLDIFRSEIKC